jgi:ATP/maltotriose-dependent transcriptional regulator MalT
MADAFVRTRPTLCILHAITLVLAHQLEKASARVQHAERCLHEELPTQQQRTLLSLIAAFRGYQTRFLGDYERSVPLGQQALELMPETEMISPLMFMFRLGHLWPQPAPILPTGCATRL